MKLKTIRNLILILLIMPFTASAATITESLHNDYQTDAIYLFIINDGQGRDIEFVTDPVVFGDAATDWSTTLFDSESLVMQGATIDPESGLFDITFWDNRNRGGSNAFDFTLEWAEYFNGVAVGQGSLYYTNGDIVAANDNFTSTVPTPIPASAWMLVSGVALLVGIRRHNKGN